MKYLIDTNIFIYLSTDVDLLSRDVMHIMEEPEDPSDHIFIAQAITEHIPLISSDTRFPFYEKQGLDLIVNKK